VDNDLFFGPVVAESIEGLASSYKRRYFIVDIDGQGHDWYLIECI
jgi:hypothetical protein